MFDAIKTYFVRVFAHGIITGALTWLALHNIPTDSTENTIGGLISWAVLNTFHISALNAPSAKDK